MIRPTNIYGCNGRERPTPDTKHVAQFGWRQFDEGGKPVLKPVYQNVFHNLTTECQYSASENDPKCRGCGHRNASNTPRSTLC
jgi:hypothetical protein